jgi:hypothetical protein
VPTPYIVPFMVPPERHPGHHDVAESLHVIRMVPARANWPAVSPQRGPWDQSVAADRPLAALWRKWPAGYRYFTDLDSFRAYVETEVLGLQSGGTQ